MRILEPEFVHQDNRRKLTQLITDDIKQVNVYHAQRGASLGDHFHKKTTEYFYLIKGSIIYNDNTLISRGTLFVVNPEERHKIECLTDVSFLSFLTKPYTKEDPDIYA